jgi:hypothetical protein
MYMFSLFLQKVSGTIMCASILNPIVQSLLGFILSPVHPGIFSPVGPPGKLWSLRLETKICAPDPPSCWNQELEALARSPRGLGTTTSWHGMLLVSKDKFPGDRELLERLSARLCSGELPCWILQYAQILGPSEALVPPTWGFHAAVPGTDWKTVPEPASDAHLLLDQSPPRGHGNFTELQDGQQPRDPADLPLWEQSNASSSATTDGVLHTVLQGKSCPGAACNGKHDECPERHE